MSVNRVRLEVAVDLSLRQLRGTVEWELPASTAFPLPVYLVPPAEVHGILLDGKAVLPREDGATAITGPARADPVSSAIAAADASRAAYAAWLRLRKTPRLQVQPLETVKLPTTEGQEAADAPAATTKPLQIDFGMPVQGMRLDAEAMLAAGPWFPMPVLPTGALLIPALELAITTGAQHTVLAPGTLVSRSAVDAAGTLHCWRFRVNHGLLASDVTLVVGSLLVQRLPISGQRTVVTACPVHRESLLAPSTSFLPAMLQFFEEFLASPFPVQYFCQAFLPPALLRGVTAAVSLGLSLFSDEAMSVPGSVQRAMDARCVAAECFSQQVFGQYIYPETPADEWVTVGLAEFLTGMYIRHMFGNNELAWRRQQQYTAICAADGAGDLAALREKGRTSDILPGERGPVWQWKAAAVMHMLERRMQPDNFKRLMQRLLADAKSGQRIVSTRSFLRLVVHMGGLNSKDLKDLVAAWIDGRGCPRLYMAVAYHSKRSVLEVAMSQEVAAGGPRESVAALTGWVPAITLRVHDAEGFHDQPVTLPDYGFNIVEIPCKGKPLKTGPKPRSRSAPAATATAAEESSTVERDCPIQWVRVDPECDWPLLILEAVQPERMWANQLERERDVIGQSLAIEALKALATTRPSYAAANALHACLQDSKVFCRIRGEAAFALGRTASAKIAYLGRDLLMKFFRERCFDTTGVGQVLPEDAADLAEYFVNLNLPSGLAAIRTEDGYSDPEVIDALLDLLEYNDGGTSADNSMLSATLDALGSTRPRDPTQLLRAIDAIERCIMLDRVLPSFQNSILSTALKSLASLSTNRISLARHRHRDALAEFLAQYCVPKQLPAVRLAAACGIVQLQARIKGLDAAIAHGVGLAAQESSIHVRVQLLDYIAVQLAASDQRGLLDDGVAQNALGVLSQWAAGNEGVESTPLQHKAYVLLQRLAAKPVVYTLLEQSKPEPQPKASEATAAEPSRAFSDEVATLQRASSDVNSLPKRLPVVKKEYSEEENKLPQAVQAALVDAHAARKPTFDAEAAKAALRIRPSSSLSPQPELEATTPAVAEVVATPETKPSGLKLKFRVGGTPSASAAGALTSSGSTLRHAGDAAADSTVDMPARKTCNKQLTTQTPPSSYSKANMLEATASNAAAQLLSSQDMPPIKQVKVEFPVVIPGPAQEATIAAGMEEGEIADDMETAPEATHAPEVTENPVSMPNGSLPEVPPVTQKGAESTPVQAQEERRARKLEKRRLKDEKRQLKKLRKGHAQAADETAPDKRAASPPSNATRSDDGLRPSTSAQKPRSLNASIKRSAQKAAGPVMSTHSEQQPTEASRARGLPIKEEFSLELTSPARTPIVPEALPSQKPSSKLRVVLRPAQADTASEQTANLPPKPVPQGANLPRLKIKLPVPAHQPSPAAAAPEARSEPGEGDRKVDKEERKRLKKLQKEQRRGREGQSSLNLSGSLEGIGDNAVSSDADPRRKSAKRSRHI
eukprot:jgi/Chlat1/7875/Chrsp66S07306